MDTEKRFKPQYVFVLVQLDAMPLIKNESFITFLLVYNAKNIPKCTWLHKVCWQWQNDVEKKHSFTTNKTKALVWLLSLN